MSDTFLPGSGLDTYEEQDKVLVGLCGGRGCRAAVRILQQQGFAVAGAVVRLTDADDTVQAAKDAAKALGIECVTLNASELASQLAEEALPGDLRFPALLAAADRLGIQYIATGHFAQVETGADGWVKISIDGEDAYVSQEFVTVEEKLDTAITMTELLYGQGVSDVRVDLVEYAKQFVGNPYVWGGTSLTKGADCSGFVLAVFKKYGIALSHSSRAQANEGTKISASDLKPGDLIFYGNGKGNINHVAIYIGGGQVIHASSPKTGIKISSYKYRTPVKCVRVIQD